MRMSDTGDLWWKNAVFYCADVETFNDSNGDGVGDFRGMTERIEYLADLGITCLWLMPFYPTARKDDGYDITDFFGVDPRLGTHGDFVELVRTAKAHGIRVIVDFVMNHTSDRHPWFRSARRSREDPYRDFYVWSRTKPRSSRKDVVFPDEETSIWDRDDVTGDWYLHHFYRHQPDLNIANPLVQEEISRTLGFWLELGVSGFRVDAVPFLFAEDGVPGVGEDQRFDPQQYLGDVRNFITRRVGDAVLLGEVNLPYPDQKSFFGGPDGDGLNMQFDFIGMQRMYLSLARGDAGPLADALRERPDLDVTSQWANFVRNHDELTLDKLTGAERREVFEAFGPDRDMQLYGRGLRRRLPPMLGGDQARLRLVYSLMFSLPGTPVLFYGEEVGMGENLSVPGRLAVRTPMQWSSEAGGGFTRARRPTRPMPKGLFAPDRVNVSDQRHDSDSFWWFMRDLIRRYRQVPQIGWSTVEVLDQPVTSVLAHRCRGDDGWSMVAVHNLSPESALVPLSIGPLEPGTRLVELGGHRAELEPTSSGRVEVEVPGHSGRWLLPLPPGIDPPL